MDLTSKAFQKKFHLDGTWISLPVDITRDNDGSL
jgi:hypothetical protein